MEERFTRKTLCVNEGELTVETSRPNKTDGKIRTDVVAFETRRNMRNRKSGDVLPMIIIRVPENYILVISERWKYRRRREREKEAGKREKRIETTTRRWEMRRMFVFSRYSPRKEWGSRSPFIMVKQFRGYRPPPTLALLLFFVIRSFVRFNESFRSFHSQTSYPSLIDITGPRVFNYTRRSRYNLRSYLQ